MSKADALQNAINISSLTMNVAEDVARACKIAEIHPSLATVLMRMHTMQIEQEREIKKMQSGMVQLAMTVDRGATISAASLGAIDALANKLGLDKSALFSPANDGNDD